MQVFFIILISNLYYFIRNGKKKVLMLDIF